MIFKTYSEAESFSGKLMRSDNEKFIDDLNSKEKFFKYIYSQINYDEFYNYNRDFLKVKLEEYTGVKLEINK